MSTTIRCLLDGWKVLAVTPCIGLTRGHGDAGTRRREKAAKRKGDEVAVTLTVTGIGKVAGARKVLQIVTGVWPGEPSGELGRSNGTFRFHLSPVAYRFH